jgi:hypothetical protein
VIDPRAVLQLFRVRPFQAARHERPEVDQHVGAETGVLEPGEDVFDTLGAQPHDLGVGEDLLEREQRPGLRGRLVSLC